MDLHGAKTISHAAEMDLHGAKTISHAAEMDLHGAKTTSHTAEMDLHGAKTISHAAEMDLHGGNVVSHAAKIDLHSGNAISHAAEIDLRVEMPLRVQETTRGQWVACNRSAGCLCCFSQVGPAKDSETAPSRNAFQPDQLDFTAAVSRGERNLLQPADEPSRA